MNLLSLLTKAFDCGDPILADKENCGIYQALHSGEKKSILPRSTRTIYTVLIYLGIVLWFLTVIFTRSLPIIIVSVVPLFFVARFYSKPRIPTTAMEFFPWTLTPNHLAMYLYLSGVRGSDFLKGLYFEKMEVYKGLYLAICAFSLGIIAYNWKSQTGGSLFSGVIGLSAIVIFYISIYRFVILIFQMIVVSTFAQRVRSWLDMGKLGSRYHYLEKLIVLFFILGIASCPVALFLNLIGMLLTSIEGIYFLCCIVFFISAVMFSLGPTFTNCMIKSDHELFYKADLAFDYCVQYVWNGEEDPEFVASFFDREPTIEPFPDEEASS